MMRFVLLSTAILLATLNGCKSAIDVAPKQEAFTNSHKRISGTLTLYESDGALANGLVSKKYSPKDAIVFALERQPTTRPAAAKFPAVSFDGGQVNPRVQILNAPGSFEVHSLDGVAHDFSVIYKSQPPHQMWERLSQWRYRFVIRAPEVFITVACNAHPKERFYVAALNSTLHTVPLADGSFHLEVPSSGDYVVVAAHPDLGQIQLDMREAYAFRSLAKLDLTIVGPR